VAETLARKGVENERGREGAYRFLTTGDPEAFRELGRRFLQLPVREVEHVTVATLEEAATGVGSTEPARSGVAGFAGGGAGK
jgi:hypothetical protein